MNNSSEAKVKNGMTAGAVLAGAVALLALPSAVLAFTTDFGPESKSQPASDSMASLRTGTAPATLARAVPIRSLAKGRLYRFTPASTPSLPDRSITVAVRVSPQTTGGLHADRSRKATGEGDGAQLRIAPTAFNLGVSRGYRNFAQDLVQSAEDGASKLPSYEKFSIAPGAKADQSRFSPRIVMDQKTTGRAPRTFAGDLEDQVDVGGSYRLTDNLDVTAGVRYSEDRERLLPLTDGKLDSQAVYVGTQFRF